MPTELELLQNISEKLSQLITLTRLVNFKAIADFKEEIGKDPVFRAIVSLADGMLSSSKIKDKVKEQTKVSERTIEGRLATLVEKGALNAVRKGNEIYYVNSGLYD